MKRVFLLIGIVGFTTASAQQKDMFDINRYLKNKSDKRINNIPKKSDTIVFKTPYHPSPNRTLLNYSFSLPNGNKAFSSPGYHMPIVAPDMQQFKTMPNVSNVNGLDILDIQKNLAGRIPNGASPLLFLANSK